VWARQVDKVPNKAERGAEQFALSEDSINRHELERLARVEFIWGGLIVKGQLGNGSITIHTLAAARAPLPNNGFGVFSEAAGPFHIAPKPILPLRFADARSVLFIERVRAL